MIDGTINGIALGIIPLFTRLASRVQSGFISHYAFGMIIGILVIISWFAISGSSP
jgi:NADH-quinone oxidoreductase subunit L